MVEEAAGRRRGRRIGTDSFHFAVAFVVDAHCSETAGADAVAG